MISPGLIDHLARMLRLPHLTFAKVDDDYDVIVKSTEFFIYPQFLGEESPAECFPLHPAAPHLPKSLDNINNVNRPIVSEQAL